jgi:hypothetical protein
MRGCAAFMAVRALVSLAGAMQELERFEEALAVYDEVFVVPDPVRRSPISRGSSSEREKHTDGRSSSRSRSRFMPRNPDARCEASGPAGRLRGRAWYSVGLAELPSGDELPK